MVFACSLTYSLNMTDIVFVLVQQLNLMGRISAKWEWVVNTTPQLLSPRKETLDPLYMRLGGPQGQSGKV
jgi:hypothetical protein